MKNNYVTKWKIFVASYLPLYCLLLLRSTNINHFDFTLLVLIILSLFSIKQLFSVNNFEQSTLPEDMVLEPEKNNVSNYLIVYIIPILTFDSSNLNNVIVNICLFLLVGLINVNSDAIYWNSFYGIFGFKLFKVSNFPNTHHIISRLSFDEIETMKKREDKIIRHRINNGIYLIKSLKK